MQIHCQTRAQLIASPIIENSALVNEYLDWKRSYAKSAARSYAIWVRRFQEFVNKPPEKLIYSDCSAFALATCETHSKTSVHFAMNIIRNYMRFFAEQGRLRFPLYMIRVPRAEVQSRNAVTEDEYQIIIKTLNDNPYRGSDRDLAIIMLLHDTGVRVGELVTLQIDDIEENKSAVIRTEKSRKQRRIFWNADTDAAIQKVLVRRVNEQSASDALFTSDSRRKGCQITQRSIQRMVRQAAAKARIDREICPHSFRHGFIHRFAKLGVPDAIIAQLVGHSTPHTIAHYTKLSRPEFEEFARRQFACN